MSIHPTNIRIHGRRTSIRMEPELWSILEEIARRRGASIHQLCSQVASERQHGQTLTSAVRSMIGRELRTAAE